MEFGGYGFEKSDLLKLAEQIYDLKAKKQELELNLSNEQFHYQYIPKRKNIIIYRMISYMLLIVLITLFILATIGNWFWFFLDMFLLYADIRLIIDEWKMFSLFLKSTNKVAVGALDMNSFQMDELESRNRIEMLQGEIMRIEQDISVLEEQQKELVEQKKNGEDFLREKGILFDEKPNVVKEKGKFALREESVAMGEQQDLYEFYLKEEQYANNYLLQLEGKLQHINKQISKIDDDFGEVVKTIILFVIGYVFLILIQSFFSATLGTITSIICTIITVVMILYLERKCIQPVVLYLIEHDNSLIQEYAFCHNMVPVRLKRQELIEKIQSVQEELDSIKKKKQALDF